MKDADFSKRLIIRGGINIAGAAIPRNIFKNVFTNVHGNIYIAGFYFAFVFQNDQRRGVIGYSYLRGRERLVKWQQRPHFR